MYCRLTNNVCLKTNVSLVFITLKVVTIKMKSLSQGNISYFISLVFDIIYTLYTF